MEEPKSKLQGNRYYKWIIFYGDTTLRAIISFLFFGLCFGFILEGIFHISAWIVLIVVIIAVIIANPLFAKVKGTEYLLIKYISWIDSKFEKHDKKNKKI